MFPVRGRRRVDRAGIAAWRSDTARLENVLGSAVPAFVVTALVSGRAGVWDLARRSLRWRVPLRWYLVGLLAPLLILLIAVTILNGFAPLRALGQNWLLLFTAFLPALAIMILLNNVAEEIGWGRIRLRPIPRSSWSAPRRLVNQTPGDNLPANIQPIPILRKLQIPINRSGRQTVAQPRLRRRTRRPNPRREDPCRLFHFLGIHVGNGLASGLINIRRRLTEQRTQPSTPPCRLRLRLLYWTRRSRIPGSHLRWRTRYRIRLRCRRNRWHLNDALHVDTRHRLKAGCRL